MQNIITGDMSAIIFSALVKSCLTLWETLENFSFS